MTRYTERRRGLSRRLYLVRHAEADTPSADGVLRSHAPLPLTARGRTQAEALGNTFAGVGTRTVHASDIRRAAETARALAGAGRDVELHEGLRELSLGDYEGAHSSAVLAAAPGFLRDPDATLPGGESIREVGLRAGPALDAILAESADDEVIVVAHGGVNRALLARLLDIPLERALALRQDWAGVNVLERTAETWTAASLNWTPEGLAELHHAPRVAVLHRPEYTPREGGG